MAQILSISGVEKNFLNTNTVLYRQLFKLFQCCPFSFQFSRCKVIGKQDKGLDVLLLPSKKKAFLPKQHLSDSLEMCNALLKYYKEKDIIEEVMYFNKSHIVVSFLYNFLKQF